MKSILYKFPFHPVLYILFLITFLIAQNPETVGIHDAFKTILVSSAFVLLMFSLSALIIKSKLKAGIITTLFLFFLFNYGVIYDFTERLYYNGVWPFKNIHRWLIMFGIVYLVSVVIIVIRRKTTFERLTYYMNVLFLILFVTNSVRVALSAINHVGDNGNVQKIVSGKSNSETESISNIYYFVLDGYASGGVLKKHYGFDNSLFEKGLQKVGFNINDSAASAYYSTLPSLASTLNMDYIPANEGLQYKLNNNKVFQLFKSKGYKIVNLESGYSVTNSFNDVDSTIEISSPNEFERSFIRYTILRLDDLFGIMQHNRLKSQIEKLEQLSHSLQKGTFYFVHLVAPHPPYVFDKNGKQVYNSKNHDNSWEPRKSYIDQLQFVNSVVLKTVNSIIDVHPDATVIIQSDHGPWITSKSMEDVFEARSQIFSAMRIPSSDSMINLKTSVNTFRFISEKLKLEDFKLLKDSAAGKAALYKSALFNNLVK